MLRSTTRIQSFGQNIFQSEQAYRKWSMFDIKSWIDIYQEPNPTKRSNIPIVVESTVGANLLLARCSPTSKMLFRLLLPVVDYVTSLPVLLLEEDYCQDTDSVDVNEWSQRKKKRTEIFIFKPFRRRSLLFSSGPGLSNLSFEITYFHFFQI